MLVLSRKTGDCIKIGPDISIFLIKIKGNKVSLGIEASSEVKISNAPKEEPKKTGKNEQKSCLGNP